MKEMWKDIPGYEELYQISNLGKVKTLKQWCGNKYINKWKPCDKLLKQRTAGGYIWKYRLKEKLK